MTEETRERRRKDDKERYDAEREARREYQKRYYRANREAILQRRKKTGFLTFGSLRHGKRKNHGTDAET